MIVLSQIYYRYRTDDDDDDDVDDDDDDDADSAVHIMWARQKKMMRSTLEEI